MRHPHTKKKVNLAQAKGLGKTWRYLEGVEAPNALERPSCRGPHPKKALWGQKGPPPLAQIIAGPYLDFSLWAAMAQKGLSWERPLPRDRLSWGRHPRSGLLTGAEF